MFTPWLRRSVAAGIGGVLLAAGCSTERMQEKLEPTARAVQPTVSAFECGGGRVKSAIAACRAEGGHFGHCAIVASREGVNSATACYTYANEVRKRRELLVGQEDQLDAQLDYLKDVNADTERLNTQLRDKTEEVTARTDTAIDSLAKGEMTQSELAQLRAILDAEVSSAQLQSNAASRELLAAQQYRATQNQNMSAALDQDIAALQASVNETQRQTSALVNQRQRIQDQ